MTGKLLRGSTTGLSAIGIALFGYAIFLSFTQGPFKLNQIQMDPLPKASPVDASVLLETIKATNRSTHLSGYSLKEIDTQIRTNSWVKSVELMKEYPGRLRVKIALKTPRALVRLPSGVIRYLDGSGEAFGEFELVSKANLPLVEGAFEAHKEEIQQFLDNWDKTKGLSGSYQISNIHWNEETGLKVLLVQNRVTLDFGVDLSQIDEKLARVQRVIDYMRTHATNGSTIIIHSSKKIIVRTPRHS